MTEKYTDLTEEIWRTDNGLTSLGSVEMVLDYLDEHPDQVPGRTITAGEVGRWSHLINGRYIETPSIIDFLEALGITVVTDSEPTNVEKLAELIREIGYDIRYNGRLSGSSALAIGLDSRGVKAPGGNDD